MSRPSMHSRKCGFRYSYLVSGLFLVLLTMLVDGIAQTDGQLTSIDQLTKYYEEDFADDNKTLSISNSSSSSSASKSSSSSVPISRRLTLSLLSYLHRTRTSPTLTRNSHYVAIAPSSWDFSLLSLLFSQSDTGASSINDDDRISNEAPLPPPSCGIPGQGRFRRVVGGTHAARCLFPWMVYISRDPGKDDLCGATLVSDRHIITAAHCYDKLDTWPVLTIGEYDRDEGATSQRKLVTSSYSLAVHPLYSRITYSYDIAVLTLSTPVRMENYECIHPLCLPEEDHELEIGDTCTVAGWGSTVRSSGGNPAVSSPSLMETEIQVVNTSFCSRKFRGFFNENSQICAGDLTGQTDSCVGDSGGPLMCGHTRTNASAPASQALYLMGVISSGAKPCAQVDTPALYTNVQAVRDWIDSVMKPKK